MWPASYCKVQRRHADELIAIAEGRTTLEQVRERNRSAMAQVRERQKIWPMRRMWTAPYMSKLENGGELA